MTRIDTGGGATAGTGEGVAERYLGVRETTATLAAPVPAEAAVVQSMPDASPVKWHLAHTTWFFDEFLLRAHEQGYSEVDPAYRRLFNSYYKGVGAAHPRGARGLLIFPSLDDVLSYRSAIDARVRALLDDGALRARVAHIAELGLQHEQQHQELLLTDLKHLYASCGSDPAYRTEALPPAGDAGDRGWVAFDGGVQWIGHAGAGFAFDNEMPRHKEYVESFALCRRLVTNDEYGAFIADGGYETPALWSDDGWAWIRREGVNAPLYWRRTEAGWGEFRLDGPRSIEPTLPVTHVSWYEADAFARWSGARLATEAELELAGTVHGAESPGAFQESGRFHPAAAGSDGVAQLMGDCWTWTGSQYRPYPGYRAPSGVLGEYNGKFMTDKFVLRGGSCVSPMSHARLTYRNFLPASARWQFSGIRLARDL